MVPVVLTRLVPAVWITDNDVVARHNAVSTRCGTIVLIGNAVVLLCDLLVLLRNNRVVILPICLSRSRCVHSRRVSRVHVRLIIRLRVMNVRILMCVHISLSLHMALRLHVLFVGDIRIMLRNCGLLISVLLGLLILLLSLAWPTCVSASPRHRLRARIRFIVFTSFTSITHSY